MKYLSSRSLLIVFILLFMGTSFICGQWGPGQPQIDHTTFNLLRKVSLNRESEKMDILIPILGSISTFSIKISSEISEGELIIEIYDPTGEKQGNYFIDTQNSLKPNKIEKTTNPDVKESVIGHISKLIDYPINGNWKVSIIPKYTVGHFEIESNQMTTKQILDKKNKR